MDTLQLGAEGLGFMHPHVTCDACCACSIVDGNETFPLLHCDWDVPRYTQSLLLHLACTRTAHKHLSSVILLAYHCSSVATVLVDLQLRG
jgi:hypothetical protein